MNNRRRHQDPETTSGNHYGGCSTTNRREKCLLLHYTASDIRDSEWHPALHPSRTSTTYEQVDRGMAVQRLRSKKTDEWQNWIDGRCMYTLRQDDCVIIFVAEIMAAQQMFEPRILYGQGKRAVTILTEDGCVYPIIAHDAKNDRVRHASAPQHARIQRGERPMHKSTLTLAKPPWNADYTTTNNQFHGGSKTLEPECRLPPAPSMHRSQFKLGRYGGYGTYPGYPGHEVEHPDVWKSDYTKTYIPKDIVPANRLHLTSLVNRIDQTEGIKMKEVVKPCKEPMNYFTQYKRVHDKLGMLRGPGVRRGYPIREQYNTITGEVMGLDWKEDNHRTSGNRVLHGIRSAMPASTIQ